MRLAKLSSAVKKPDVKKRGPASKRSSQQVSLLMVPSLAALKVALRLIWAVQTRSCQAAKLIFAPCAMSAH